MGISVDCWIPAAQPTRLHRTVLLQIYDLLYRHDAEETLVPAPFPTSNIVDLIPLEEEDDDVDSTILSHCGRISISSHLWSTNQSSILGPWERK